MFKNILYGFFGKIVYIFDIFYLLKMEEKKLRFLGSFFYIYLKMIVLIGFFVMFILIEFKWILIN